MLLFYLEATNFYLIKMILQQKKQQFLMIDKIINYQSIEEK